jgi:hypothetical protein
MDLTEVLRSRLDTIASGEHTIGLRAVLQHISVAVSHFERGQKTGDDTAFTDAIYRTNQAFEGSLKEAYRVIAERDPATIRPFDIENFLQNQNLLRPRVLAQFSTYRKEWRNPSAHDYRLDFDEDEALLAIVSVSAFAIVLIDQISEKLSFEKARATAVDSIPVKASVPLADQIAEALQAFRWQRPTEDTGLVPRSSDLIGAIGGYLLAVLPNVRIDTDVRIGDERADLIVSRDSERAIVEVKRNRSFFLGRSTDVSRLLGYLEISGIEQGVLYGFSRTGAEMQIEVLTKRKWRIVLVSPVRTSPGLSTAVPPVQV